MKLLGLLFLLVLVVAAVGYGRGWLSVAASHASGKTGGVAVTVDDDKITDDAAAVAQHVPTSVAATRGGVAVPFEPLRANMRARFSFEQTGAARHLVRFELLQ